MTPTPLIPAPRGTVAPVTTIDVTGSPADVMWTVGRYREMGALACPPETRPTIHPGEETARVRLVVGTPVLPVGPDDPMRYDAIDYLIAAAPIVKYGLITAAVVTAGYGIYSTVKPVVAWFDTNGAAMVSGVVSVVALLALVMLLAALRGGGKGCAGLHCGGCKG
jgi:hypothetical protein